VSDNGIARPDDRQQDTQHDRQVGDRATPGAFVHEGLFYAGITDYLAATVPFVLDGLKAGEPVAVAVPGPNLERIAECLGDTADAVRMIDMTVAGRNPGAIMATVLTRFIDEHPGRRVRIIDEPIWAERSANEYPACVQHEALVNVALAGRQATLLCPYDTRHLEPSALVDATRTHPVLVEGGHRCASPSFHDPLRLAAALDVPLEPPPESADVEMMVFDANIGARGVRRFVHEHALRAGLDPGRTANLRAAAREVALNTLVHTGRPGILSMWVEAGHLVCEVQDSGSITDPLAGLRPPEPFDGDDPRGSGLGLVHGVCDLVRTHLTGYGMTIRMYVRLGSD
jgi:anti-sigma regulatory factor (Ser/Thr protein kinase)